jgi:2-polyprenyl-3-methyl-5-hydroxy-6-metoxy-1,4-benzoquinol methylase
MGQFRNCLPKCHIYARQSQCQSGFRLKKAHIILYLMAKTSISLGMKAAATHTFSFGENWKNFSRGVSSEHIDKATENLVRLLGSENLQGQSFMDIGSGSGLHSLAALRLNASRIAAIDADQDSVEATRAMLVANARNADVLVQKKSILEPVAANAEKFDIVYSWGVLHHTGDMWKAIENSMAYVAPGGKFVIALYKKSPMCGFWRVEKSIYSRLPNFLRFPVTSLYSALYLAGIAASGRNPIKYVKTYTNFRGMNFWHDAIDWLGGYPYESASPEEVERFFTNKGFKLQQQFNISPPKASGLFGVGCAEYIFVKVG